MIKCIIVEDEMLAQQVLQNHLQQLGKLELVGVCNNAREAAAVLQKHEIDLMFLDIQLPGMTGLHFLGTLANPPLVILTTAYAEYAVASYEFNVIDYLLKPVSFERFCKAIDKIADNKLLPKTTEVKDNTATNHIFVKSNGKFFKVNFTEIIYIEGMKDYLKIHTTIHTLVTLQTMTDIEKILPSREFIRVHKSFIIAVSHIKSIYGNSIEMGNETIPIGINYKDKIAHLVNKKYLS